MIVAGRRDYDGADDLRVLYYSEEHALGGSEACGDSLQSKDMAEMVREENERQGRYNPAEIETKWQERWDADRLSFEGGALGQKITGRVDVLADAVRIELDLPEILAAIADRIRGRLQSAAQKLLEKK